MSSTICKQFLVIVTVCATHIAPVAIGQEAPTAEQQAPPAGSVAPQQDAEEELSIDEIHSLLESIPPYLPKAAVTSEIDIFGSTTMDSLAHGWAQGFRKFHEKAEVVISAEGSETVFDRLLKKPSSIGMLARPVTKADLDRLKSKGLKKPVAIQVARDALGVFVHQDNPLDIVDRQQLATLFTSADATKSVKWSDVGVEGKFGDAPVHILGRAKGSGTQKFIEDFLFHAQSMRADEQSLKSNSEVIAAVAKDPYAVAIVDVSCSGERVKRLHLRDNSTVIKGTDHEILLGHYPIVRPMALVFDMGQDAGQVVANAEFVRYALSQAGQTQAILSGFFPFDPATLRAQLEELGKADPREPMNTAAKTHERK